MNAPQQNDPLKDNLPPTLPSSLEGVVPTFDASKQPEFIPDPIEDILDVSKLEDLKIVEESIRTGPNEMHIIVNFDADDEMDRLDIYNLDARLLYSENGASFPWKKVKKFFSAIINPPQLTDPQAKAILLGEAIVDADLDELLKFREKGETNQRIKLFLGRVRSELKEIRS